MRMTVLRTAWFALAVVLLSCCVHSNEPIEGPVKMQTHIAAGPGEKSFTEQYDLRIVLPMPEKDFVAVLGRLGLSHDSCGERGTKREMPPPKWSNVVDLANFQSCIQIYGKNDAVRRVGKIYRAYVDPAGQVTYIENAFAYTGP